MSANLSINTSYYKIIYGNLLSRNKFLKWELIKIILSLKLKKKTIDKFEYIQYIVSFKVTLMYDLTSCMPPFYPPPFTNVY